MLEKFKIMRKSLLNYSVYSHPEIGKFQGVTLLSIFSHKAHVRKHFSRLWSDPDVSVPGYRYHHFHVLVTYYTRFHR
jgi:hypothetical protein